MLHPDKNKDESVDELMTYLNDLKKRFELYHSRDEKAFINSYDTLEKFSQETKILRERTQICSDTLKSYGNFTPQFFLWNIDAHKQCVDSHMLDYQSDATQSSLELLKV